MTKLATYLAYLALASVLTGCGANVLDAGSNGDDPAGTVQGNRRSFPPPSHSFGCVPGREDCWGQPCLGSPPSWLAGSWEGEFDSLTLPSGSKTLTVHFDGRGRFEDSPGVCGRVIFGQGAAPPLPTDPEALPQGTSIDQNRWSRLPTEGFIYEFYPSSELTDSTPMPGQVVSFGLFAAQVYKAWCEIQFSYPQRASSGDAYGCLPPSSGWGSGALGCGSEGNCCLHGAPNLDDSRPVSCAQLLLCNEDPACDCSGTGCTIDIDTIHSRDADLLFNLDVDAETASGSAVVDGTIDALSLRRIPQSPPR
jgi:hypothetical protein